ncbi:MAG: hypothetical protein B6D61_02635 [Bacteroidetes bacterium 4484_249]|nr:MAG: hypothetical protein B6D61_02635 [Bacteroidetes bacterium 4484_249]
MRLKFDEGTSGYTKIKFKVVLSSTDREDRIIEVIKEFDWDGNARFVETEVYDLADSCVGKNSLHSDNASSY